MRHEAVTLRYAATTYGPEMHPVAYRVRWRGARCHLSQGRQVMVLYGSVGQEELARRRKEGRKEGGSVQSGHGMRLCRE